MKNKSMVKRINLLILTMLILTVFIAGLSIFTLSRSDISVNSGNTTIVVIAIICLIIIIAAVILIRYAKNIFYHISFMARGIGQIGAKGDLNFPPDVMASAQHCSSWNNEIGVVARAAGGLIQHLTSLEQSIKSISEGNLNVDIEVLSEGDLIGNGLAAMVDRLNEMLNGFSLSSVQIATGAKQIADGSQSLAQGATEQAVSMEELSSSIAEITSMAKANTQAATGALEDVQQSEQLMGVCMAQMTQMLEAMRTIDEKSQSISKTTKIIDDIAFQTNILALNAAVEAARAGQHGKGFAVVAEEVRNLAAKSAEAAKETGVLIESSSRSVIEGGRIVEQVSGSLQSVAEIAQRNAEQFANVQSISTSQSAAMEQINSSIDQVAQVVQQNSATAQESAAASEEMSSQSSLWQDLISQFKLKGRDTMQRKLPTEEKYLQKRLATPEKTGVAVSGDNGYGKY